MNGRSDDHDDVGWYIKFRGALRKRYITSKKYQSSSLDRKDAVKLKAFIRERKNIF